jgi:hypothetical protein
VTGGSPRGEPPLYQDDPMTEANDLTLSADGRAELAAAQLRLLVQARHELCIYSPALESGLLDNDDAFAELRRIATGGRHARIRVLLHEPARALLDGHRLVSLFQRLPTAVQLRAPTESADLAYASAFLLNDAGGFLFRPQAHRFEARGSLSAAGERAQLQVYFDEVWERSIPAADLRPLGI